MALETAFFKLGTILFLQRIVGLFIILQILGLVMGDPLSPPLAQIFVAFDEYHHKLLNHTANTNIVRTFIDRYMDDIEVIALTRTDDDIHVKHFLNIFADSYEHDLPKKHLTLVRSKDGDKFLDSDIIIYNNKRNIKIIYHNKNASIIHTDLQNVGRFLHKTANAPYTAKLSALTNVITRIPRTTTLAQDMIPCIHQVLHEATTLDFTLTDIKNVLRAAKNSDDSEFWQNMIDMLP